MLVVEMVEDLVVPDLGGVFVFTLAFVKLMLNFLRLLQVSGSGAGGDEGSFVRSLVRKLTWREERAE